MISVRPYAANNFNVAIFLDPVNMINVKVFMTLILTELYPFVPLPVILIVFHSVKQF